MSDLRLNMLLATDKELTPEVVEQTLRTLAIELYKVDALKDFSTKFLALHDEYLELQEDHDIEYTANHAEPTEVPTSSDNPDYYNLDS